VIFGNFGIFEKSGLYAYSRDEEDLERPFFSFSRISAGPENRGPHGVPGDATGAPGTPRGPGTPGRPRGPSPGVPGGLFGPRRPFLGPGAQKGPRGPKTPKKGVLPPYQRLFKRVRPQKSTGLPGLRALFWGRTPSFWGYPIFGHFWPFLAIFGLFGRFCQFKPNFPNVTRQDVRFSKMRKFIIF